MNILIIHGSNRKGSTYHMARQLVDALLEEGQSGKEFFLPRDMGHFCMGCATCFAKGEEFCPHADQVQPIRRAIEEADLLVFTTPVYALRCSGQMKALLDHLSYLFMTHRPLETMFSKSAVILSTAAGGVIRGTMKDISISLRFWGIAKIYRYGSAVYASEWEQVAEERKGKINSRINRLASKIKKKQRNIRPGLLTKILFNAFRFFHKNFAFNPKDVAYWRERGWLQRARPWKRR